MAKVKDCPGFETFGADVKEARKAKNLARKDLAEKVNIDTILLLFSLSAKLGYDFYIL